MSDTKTCLMTAPPIPIDTPEIKYEVVDGMLEMTAYVIETDLTVKRWDTIIDGVRYVFRPPDDFFMRAPHHGGKTLEDYRRIAKQALLDCAK